MLGALQKDGDHYRGACGIQVLHDGGAGVTSAVGLTSSGVAGRDSLLCGCAWAPGSHPGQVGSGLWRRVTWAGGGQSGAATTCKGWRRQPDWRWREGRAPFSLALRLAGHGVSSESVAASQDRKHLQLVQLSAPASHHFRRGVHCRRRLHRTHRLLPSPSPSFT